MHRKKIEIPNHGTRNSVRKQHGQLWIHLHFYMRLADIAEEVKRCCSSCGCHGNVTWRWWR